MRFYLSLLLILSVNSVFAQQKGKELISFSLSKATNSNLLTDVSVSGPTESYNVLTLPPGTNVSALKPTFTVSAGAKVTVNNTAQTSGVSANNFSGPVIYRVTAEDGSTRDYTIEVSMQVDIAALEDAVKAFMTKYEVPGLSIAILKNEKLVYAKGYGIANKETGEQVTPNSLFRVASISKSITAMAAMKLVDEGKLNLDQKVFGAGGILGTTYGTKPYTPQLEQITVRHLLSHTAGGDAWTNTWDPANNKLDPFYQKEWVGYTNEQVISAVLDNRPVTQTPGTKFVYSNIGINIAGRVIEKVSGMKYDKYVQDHLLTPLGIDAATMKIGGTTLAERAPNEVVYYNPYPGYDQPYDFPVPRMDAHSGWIITAASMARLLAFTDGNPAKKDILSAGSVQAMLTPSATSLAPLNGGFGYGYGLGAYVTSTATANTHDGSMAGTSTTWWRYANGYTYVAFANTRRNESTYVPDLEGFLYTALFSGTPLAYTQLMKGDQFDTYYGQPTVSKIDYCLPTQRYIYSCASSDGTIGIEAFKIWSAGKKTALLDSKGMCSQNGNAYSDLTKTMPTIKLDPGASFPFQIEAMRVQSGASKDKIFISPVSIWIDLDQNNVFTDDERVYYSSSVQSYPNPLLDSQFNIPATAKPGQTRLRIRLGTASTGKPETPCEQIDGETEDYLVEIGTNCTLAATLKASAPVICQGVSTTLTGQATGGQGTLTYNWQRDNVSLTEAGSVLPVATAGVYTITVRDASGCSASSAVPVTVNPLPTVSVTGNNWFCTGKATSLSAVVAGGSSPYIVQWQRGADAAITANMASLTMSGTYMVTAKDANGCSGVGSVTVTEAKNPVPVITGSTALCTGQTSILTVGSTEGTAPFAISWLRDQISTGTISSTLAVTATGTYIATLLDAKGCTASSSVSVGIGTLPDALIKASSLNIVTNSTVSLSANTGTGLTYQWSLNGNVITGATSSVYPAQSAGVYTVLVSNGGCSTTSPGVTITLITAVEPLTPGLTLAVLPNPILGQTTVVLTLDSPASAVIFLVDASGRSLRSWSMTTRQRKHELMIDCTSLPTGTYLFKAVSDEKQVVRKVVKE